MGRPFLRDFNAILGWPEREYEVPWKGWFDNAASIPKIGDSDVNLTDQVARFRPFFTASLARKKCEKSGEPSLLGTGILQEETAH